MYLVHTRFGISYPKKSIREAVARQWRPVINYKSKKGGTTATRSGNRGELRFRVKYEILLSMLESAHVYKVECIYVYI